MNMQSCQFILKTEIVVVLMHFVAQYRRDLCAKSFYPLRGHREKPSQLVICPLFKYLVSIISAMNTIPRLTPL